MRFTWTVEEEVSVGGKWLAQVLAFLPKSSAMGSSGSFELLGKQGFWGGVGDGIKV